MSMPKKDAFAKFRYCGCLSCEIITLVLDRQPETRSANWNTHEVLHALSEASAFFCNEILAHGSNMVRPAEDLHALVLKKIGMPQHRPAPIASAPAQSSAPDGATLH
jgi:hypothetical protein